MHQQLSKRLRRTHADISCLVGVCQSGSNCFAARKGTPRQLEELAFPVVTLLESLPSLLTWHIMRRLHNSPHHAVVESILIRAATISNMKRTKAEMPCTMWCCKLDSISAFGHGIMMTCRYEGQMAITCKSSLLTLAKNNWADAYWRRLTTIQCTQDIQSNSLIVTAA